METESLKPVILYAEDDQDDFDALHEGLLQLSDSHELRHARNGTEVVKYLEAEVQPRPSLLVLDLNMPVMDGKEVLHWIKQQPAYQDLPIMIFTTSSREEDIRLCKQFGCTFFRKPTLYRDLLHVIQTMLQMSG